MNDLTISKFAELFETMSLEFKVELLSLLSASIKKGVSGENEEDKSTLARELFGAWSDTDDNLTNMIYATRTTSDREINFD